MAKILLVCIIGFMEVLCYNGLYQNNYNHYQYSQEWEEFKNRFHKSYPNEVEEYRRKGIFINNYRGIVRHNELFESGEESYTMSVNAYTDLGEEEFDKKMNGANATIDTIDDEDEYDDFEEDYDEDDFESEELDDSINDNIDDNGDNDDINNNYYRQYDRRRIKRYLRHKRKHSHKHKHFSKKKSHKKSHVKKNKIPSYIDWRKKGAVTAVKDQDSCGSCYAFSATGAIEAQYFKKTGQLISLSEQQLVDCTKPNGNWGCNGGWPKNTFLYLKKNPAGISTAAAYPYTGNEGPCRPMTNVPVILVKGYKKLRMSEHQLKLAVATRGPVPVVVDATRFQFYTSGVFHHKKCSARYQSLNHAMLVVGYGYRKKGGPYWLLKNSWGPTWGENGYMKLARNRKNHCGIVTRAVVPYL